MMPAAVLFLAATSVVHAFPSSYHRPGFVEFPLLKTEKDGHALVKVPTKEGNGLVEARLVNEQYYYQIQLGIGNPSQNLNFTIDTGSADLWVMSASNSFCTSNPNNNTGINCTGSVFHPELSATFHSLGTPFHIEYGDHTMAKGYMAADTVRVGDAAVLNATFAIANEVNSSTCVFGVGFIGNEAEAHVHRNGSGVYPTYFNVPTLMKEQNIISTNAYSLWLNDVDAESGSILFGGIDRAKYSGDLTVMPVYNNYHEFTDRPTQTRVMLNSISVDGAPLLDFNIAVLLDSGTSFSYLPQQIVETLGKAIGFVYDDIVGYYFGGIDTALNNVETLNLNFSGAEINIPLNNLLVGLTLQDGVTPLVINGQSQAILAMGSADDDYLYILGDVFLRSMYAVFDIDHYEIALANAKVNVTDSDVVTIGASIPGALQAPYYAHTFPDNSSYSTHPFTPATPAPSVFTIDPKELSSLLYGGPSTATAASSSSRTRSSGTEKSTSESTITSHSSKATLTTVRESQLESRLSNVTPVQQTKL